MDVNVETYWNLLVRSRLMGADDARQWRLRWMKESGPRAHETLALARWLVANRLLTEYQAGLLLRGHADHFFLGDYKLLDRIGKGRMAGVYRAVHRLGQMVAIKVLPPSKVKDAEGFGRFQREARLAVRLQHPNIVRTYQRGLANGLHFIVMEYLEGETLEEVLQKRRQLPPQEAVDIIYQALLGLEHMHQADMVHRDLSPANLMLVDLKSPDSTAGATVKVLDIGLGKALFDEGTPGSNSPVELTSEGSILGNPDYMSPEQARDPRRSDIRADIYSLGCVLYHTLAGRLPFVGSNLVNKLVQHANAAPPPLRQFNPAVSEELQGMVERMMAKDPVQRYPTPQAAANDVKALRQGAREEAATATSQQLQDYLHWLNSQTVEEAEPEPMPARPMPASPPVAPAPPLATPVAIEAVPISTVPPPSKILGLTRREWLLFLIGGGLVFLAVLGSLVLLGRGDK